MATIAELSAQLARGEITSSALVERALAAARDPDGEGARAFLSLSETAATAAADADDRLRAAGIPRGPLAGLPVSIKDLFDVAGEVTAGGSQVLADAEPARADAPVVARLRAAGAVLVGRTNMTEFAYSGLGLNPHFGTPRNPWERSAARIPGGSSSGAAVSVADRMAVAALATDTGGSVRIPAALCGLVGFKPTQRRVPLDGVLPLSPSLDSVGPIARSIDCCARIDAILSGSDAAVPPARNVAGLRIAVPTTVVLDRLDDRVAATFERALSTLSAAGASITEIAFPELAEIAPASHKGGLVAAEAYTWHRPLLAERGADYDPRVRVRILKGEAQSAADYLDVLAFRRRLIAAFEALAAPFDIIACPTVPMVAPTIAELEDDARFADVNLLFLRNPTVVNLVDGCALSLPCHRPGEAPVGFMAFAAALSDRRLLALGLGLEQAFAAAGMAATPAPTAFSS